MVANSEDAVLTANLSLESEVNAHPKQEVPKMKNPRKHQFLKSGTAQALAFALLAGGVVTLAGALPAGAAPSSGVFAVKAVDTVGHKAVVGPVVDLVDGGTPGGEASFALRELSTNYYTYKAADGKPAIMIPGFEIDGSKISTARDFKITISKDQVPFNHGNVTIKSGLPGWAKVSYDDEKITISTNTEFGQVGGAIKVLKFDKMQFTYDVPSYTAAQTSSKLNKQATGRLADVEVHTSDPQQFSFGKWSTTIDTTEFKANFGSSLGEPTLNTGIAGGVDGFSFTKISENKYTLTYSGTNQNRFIKGVDAVTNVGEDVGTGFTTIQSLLLFAEGAPVVDPGGEVSNAAGNVTVKQSQTARKVTLTYVKLPSTVTPWTIDLDLSKLVAIDKSKTPVVYNNQFTLTKKSGDIYTLAWTPGNGNPLIGGTLAIDLPW